MRRPTAYGTHYGKPTGHVDPRWAQLPLPIHCYTEVTLHYRTVHRNLSQIYPTLTSSTLHTSKPHRLHYSDHPTLVYTASLLHFHFFIALLGACCVAGTRRTLG